MTDRKIARLLRELRRRLPGTTLITGPMADEPDSGEVLVEVLNAPMEPLGYVDSVARPLVQAIWGDGPRRPYVRAVSPETSRKYYAQHLIPARRPTAERRRGRPTRRTKRARTR